MKRKYVSFGSDCKSLTLQNKKWFRSTGRIDSNKIMKLSKNTLLLINLAWCTLFFAFLFLNEIGKISLMSVIFEILL